MSIPTFFPEPVQALHGAADMNTLKLTDTQCWTAINALRVAAVQYATDAHVHANVHANVATLKQQFLDQATLANNLADYIEEQS